MEWINTKDEKPPLKTPVLGFFNQTGAFKFKGYCVVERNEFPTEFLGILDEYQFNIPGENYGQAKGPVKWCRISIPPKTTKSKKVK